MSRKRMVENVRVADPCSESWDQMTGNDRVRFCSHCAKDVTDISTITRRQAERLVRSAKGSICIRYIVDPVTKAPVFADRFIKITRRASTIAAGVMSASFALSNAGYAQSEFRSPASDRDAASITETDIRNDKGADPGLTNISGTVTDPNGAVIVGATIVLSAGGNGQKWSVTTDDLGTYMISGVSPGKYSLRVNYPGFVEDDSELNIQGQVAMIEDRTLEVRYEVLMGVVGIAPRMTPLSQAVNDDDIEAAMALLVRGAEVNTVDVGYDDIPPLFVAVQNGNLKMAALLIEWGAYVNVLDDQKQTALMQLDEDSVPELVELLVKNGAKVDPADADGNTALILAAENANADVVKALIDAGADIRAKNSNGMNALMAAAYDDDVDKVRILLQAGAAADINEKDNDGETAWDKTSEDEIQSLLLSYGAVKPQTIREPGVGEEPN